MHNMAASKEAQVDILTSCPICFETFKSPKYLPCLHSFCAGCLQTYITSAFRVNSVCKGIDCPVCRAFVQKLDSRLNHNKGAPCVSLGVQN